MFAIGVPFVEGLNESPSEKEGKFGGFGCGVGGLVVASMKVPPKRKGNTCLLVGVFLSTSCLNESPSEKEGK